ncbi:hypothetical protein, partial [Klebsiella pneumoniae]|uniref:hypothetical protein n=1 Tax=Klebsiella pneumoniae TaxID=573 RepID=UPI003716D451
ELLNHHAGIEPGDESGAARVLRIHYDIETSGLAKRHDMRNGQNNNKRMRNRNNHSNNNNRRGQNPMTRVYDSNGPD